MHWRRRQQRQRRSDDDDDDEEIAHFMSNQDAVHIIIIMTGCAVCLRNNK